MFLKAVFVVLTFSSFVKVNGQTCPTGQVYTPSSDEYLFTILKGYFHLNLNNVNAFDSPTSVAAAPTTIKADTWSVTELQYYNYFAASSYCPYTLANLTCCYCSKFNSTVTNYTIIENSAYGTLALVTLHPSKNEIVVTFRGSLTLMNWIMDFTFLPDSQNANVQVHIGFYLSLMSVYNQVVQYVDQLVDAHRTYRVVIVGHSLGGAMASQFIYFVTSRNQFPETTLALVTLGQPRAGNQGYANYMNNLTIKMGRVVARADLVPHLPPVNALGLVSLPFLPTLLPLYYVHDMQEIWINGTVTKNCSRTKFEDFTCSNSMGPTYSILDHGRYFDADYTICLAEGWGGIDLVSLPIGFTPTDYIPPMPTFMTNYAAESQGGYQGIFPLV